MTTHKFNANVKKSLGSKANTCKAIKVGRYFFTISRWSFKGDELNIGFISNADTDKALRMAKAGLPIKTFRKRLVASRMFLGLSLNDINIIIDSLSDWKHSGL